MAKIIFYSRDANDEVCYDIDYWYQYLEDAEINSLELIEMEFDKKNSTRWCTFHQEFLDGGECGKLECGEYSPQNGNRGKCVFKKYTLKETEKRITITTDTKFNRG